MTKWPDSMQQHFASINLQKALTKLNNILKTIYLNKTCAAWTKLQIRAEQYDIKNWTVISSLWQSAYSVISDLYSAFMELFAPKLFQKEDSGSGHNEQ